MVGLPDELAEAGRLQQRLCEANGSPTYAAIIAELVASLHQESNPAVGLLLRDERDPTGSAVFLRLLGAVRRVLERCPGSKLAAYYPVLGGESDPSAAVQTPPLP